jgi:hypothetical protein
MNKQQILSEIRRTAKGNGGVALGIRAFSKATGVGEAHWRGRYWARWSEAVREAGAEPNKRPDRYRDEDLLEKYASLVREFGRFPVVSELRLRKRTDATLPNHERFERFGSKQQLATRLLAYCAEREGYEDVAAVCAPVAKIDQDELKVDDIGSATGFVYLLKAGRFYKIGHSNSVGRREYELAIQLPQKATTVHKIETDDPAGIEAYWHKRFQAKRANGEWFQLDQQDVLAFRRRKFM